MGKKILFLISIMWLLCGCQVNYNITISDDIKVKEEVIVNKMGTSTYYESLGYSSYKEYFNQMYALYYDDIKERNYVFNKNINASTKEFSLSRESDLLSFSMNNLLKGNLFDNTSIREEGKLVTINFTPPDAGMRDDIISLGSYTININLPYEVVSHNANKINSLTNTYIWYFSENQFEDVYLVFDKTNKNNGEYKEKINIDVVIIVLVVIAIVIFGLIFYNKNANKFKISTF